MNESPHAVHDPPASAETLRERLLDNLAQAVIATNLRGEVIFWNRHAETLYGWKSAEVVGRDIREILTTLNARADTEIMEAVARGKPWSGESIVTHRDGHRLPIYVTLSPIVRDGSVEGLVGISREITEDKCAEDGLRRSEARYRALVSAVPDLIFRFDQYGRFIDCVGPTDKLVIRLEEFVGKRVWEVLSENTAAQVQQAIDQALGTGRKVRREIDVTVRDVTRSYETIFAPGDSREIVAVARDVTTRKADRERLNEALAELEQRVEQRTLALQNVNTALLEQIERRHEVENALRNSYARLQTVINASPAAIVEVDRDGVVLSWSDTAERMFGWSAEEAIGRVNPIVAPHQMDEFKAILGTVSSGVSLSPVVLVRHHKSGHEMPVALSAAAVPEPAGKRKTFIFLYTAPDRSAETSMSDLSARLGKLKSLTSAATATLDIDSVMRGVQRELELNFAIRAGALMEHKPSAPSECLYRWGPETPPSFESSAASVPSGIIRAPATDADWLRIPLPYGKTDWGLLTLRLPSGAREELDIELLAAAGRSVASAITNARLHDEVVRSNARLVDLSRRLLVVQEEERRHVGRELHDQIGQMLTGLKLRLTTLTANDDPQDTAEVEGLVADLMDHVRDLSLALRPPMLDDAGLIPALRWHVERYSAETGIEVDFRHSPVERLHTDVETAAFRIIQEAMTNTARHARARRLRLRVWSAGERLFAEIADDGVGFVVPGPSAHTAGIIGMRERASLVNGSIVIESGPGGGTRVAVELPALGGEGS